jgi:hypothetical protein
MDVPIGAPQPELPDECPLDTFLRVAPDDALVPPALLAACGRAADAAVPHTAGELDTAHLALAIGPAALTGPLCTREAFDSRAVALAKDAGYVPKIQSCDQECVWGEVWDQTSCAVVDGDGNFLGWCDPGVYADLLEFVGPYGEYCEEYQPVNCQWVPNPACDPTVATYPDWGPWLDWQRFSTFPTTAMRVETSVCGPDGASAYWQDKAKSGDAWGVKHTFAIPGNYISVLTLHAGWDANGTYLGRYYLGHVSGFGFHVASAWLGMVGDPHLSCPLKI